MFLYLTILASWATAAAGFIESKFNPQTYGISGKLDEARDAAAKEGAFTIEMSWDVNCDMDLHCFFQTEKGHIQKIFYSQPRFCVKCPEEYSSGRARNCNCGPEYLIYLRLDHTSGPATELITVGKSVKGRGVFGAHVYSGRNIEGKIEVTGIIRAKNGAQAKSPKLIFDGHKQTKTTKQMVFDGSEDNPNSHLFSEGDFGQHAKKILTNGGGLLFPDPLDKPMDAVELSEQERQNRVELLSKDGYDKVKVEPSIPPEKYLMWESGIGSKSKNCPQKLSEFKDLSISINNPAVQPAMYGKIRDLPNDKKSNQIFVLVSPGETVSGQDTRPMPKGGNINATKSGATFEPNIFPHLFKNYPMLQIDKIFLLGKCFFCTFIVHHKPSKEQSTALSEFMGLELTVSPKCDSFLLESDNRKLKHAFGAHKFPVLDTSEFRTIGICIQAGWKIPIGSTESEIFIQGPPKFDAPKPWYEYKDAKRAFSDAITDATIRRPIMDRITKICMDPKAFSFLSTYEDPTYPEKTSNMNKVLKIRYDQLASLEIPKNKKDIKSYCDKIWNENKDPNMLLWVDDPEVLELIETTSKMPATEGRKKIFTDQMINIALKPLEIRMREKRRREEIEKEEKDKKSRHQEELARQEERFNAKVNSALAVKLEEPRSSQGGQICVVCMNQTVETVFNCGHAFTCQNCSRPLDTCPICRSIITSMTRLYLSGRDE